MNVAHWVNICASPINLEVLVCVSGSQSVADSPVKSQLLVPRPYRSLFPSQLQ